MHFFYIYFIKSISKIQTSVENNILNICVPTSYPYCYFLFFSFPTQRPLLQIWCLLLWDSKCDSLMHPSVQQSLCNGTETMSFGNKTIVLELLWDYYEDLKCATETRLQSQVLRRATHVGRLEEMGRSAVCKDSLLFRVVLCRAGSGDPNPLDENKLVLKQLTPGHSLLFPSSWSVFCQ